jgi:hypothetical protein
MLVAGVLLSEGAIAILARRLRAAEEFEVAETLGLAVDANDDVVPIGVAEGRAILVVLNTNCPPALEPLRLALQARA